MAVIVIPEALQVVVAGANLGTPWVNTYGIKGDGAFLLDQSVADEIGFAFRNAIVDVAPSLNFAWSVTSIQIRDLRTSTSPTWEADVPLFSGSNAGEAMPPQMAIVASHSTGQRGASFRGRTYLNGWTESVNEADGSVSAGARTTIVTMFEAIQTDLAAVTGGPFTLAVLSRKLLEANPITNTTVDTEWDRQDRRKRS